jgi:hypothetical protein
MSDHNQELEYLVRQIDGSLELLDTMSCQPQAFVLPFQGSMTDEFVIVWLHFHRERLSLTLFLRSLQLVVGTVLASRFVSLCGLELVFCILDEHGNSDRILRASIHTYALEATSTLLPCQLLERNPIDGIQCGWYWDRNLIMT